MADAMPTLPPARTARVQAAAQRGTHWDGPSDAFDAALAACTRCPLHGCATQVVPGVGPMGAKIMIVGEQPGDQEDLTGTPFVGLAGKLLGETLAHLGISRADHLASGPRAKGVRFRRTARPATAAGGRPNTCLCPQYS